MSSRARECDARNRAHDSAQRGRMRRTRIRQIKDQFANFNACQNSQLYGSGAQPSHFSIIDTNLGL